METLNRTQTFAPKLIGAALVAATLSAPLAAHATKPTRPYTTNSYDYERCKKADKDNQIVGGIIGAIAGGVLGSEIAGRGDGTEGAIIGAIAGATAGAAIGDDSRNCRKEARRSYTSSGYSSNGAKYQTTTYSSGNRGRGYTGSRNYSTTRSYSQPKSYSRTYTRPYSSGYTRTTTYNSAPRSYSRGYTSKRPYSGSSSYGYDRGYDRKDYRRDRKKLERLNYRLKELCREQDILKDKLSYRYDPYLKKQLAEVTYKIDEVKDKRRRVRKRLRQAKAYHYDKPVQYKRY